ncbi:MAG: hypothetical protein QM805_18360, partial [Pseudomonas sp.]
MTANRQGPIIHGPSRIIKTMLPVAAAAATRARCCSRRPRLTSMTMPTSHDHDHDHGEDHGARAESAATAAAGSA